MNLIFKLGFRNLLRNKNRTFLAALAIGVGLASLILADGFIKGMRESMVNSLTGSYLGHAQIYRDGYRDNPEVKSSILNKKELHRVLNSKIQIEAWSERVVTAALITSPANVVNIQLVGIDPLREPKLSRIEENISEGSYIENGRDVLLGEKLAKKLDTRIGERIVLTVVQVGSNEITQELFRLKGLFRFNANGFDDSMAFISGVKLGEMLGEPGAAHEIVMRFVDSTEVENRGSDLWSSLSSEGNELTAWMDLVPGLMAALAMSDASTSYISIFLFAVVLLGIMNTLFMSIYERTYEFGVLQAIGTRPMMIFKTIMAEAFFLGVLSSVFGSVLILIVGGILNIYGVDYGGIEMAETTFSEPIYMIFTWQQFVFYPAELIVFTLLAAIYPSVHAAKITIAEAMKKSL